MPKTQSATWAGLDETDLAILRALALDAHLTNKALAARLGLAESTCAYRIRALRDRGVIRGTRVQLALGFLGFPIQAVIKVRLGSHDRDHVNRLYADLTRVPGVLQALHVAGDARAGHLGFPALFVPLFNQEDPSRCLYESVPRRHG